MTSCFTRYLLKKNGLNELTVVSEPLSKHPREYDDSGDHSGILIGGGFPGSDDRSPYPLSATLQLNADRSGHNAERLAQIGLAEYERRSGKAYRSYSLEPDLRLCVIADDAARLERFVDTYGGILNLECLNTGTSHPVHPQVTALNITPRAGGCYLEYEVKAPISRDRCIYCGACGAVCPEQCLSENLYLDYEACTLCKACENACPVGAIDLAAVEERTMEVPAIVTLGAVQPDVPGGSEAVYGEAELDRYFATLYAARVEEVVSCNRRICQYHPPSRSGCRRCAEICPSGAIGITENGVEIDALKCIDCGSCVGRCPTGALQYERFSDSSFIDYFNTYALEPGTTVVIGREEALHRLWWLLGPRRLPDTFFFEFPAVAALSPMHLLFLLSRGAGRIVLLEREHGTGESGLVRTAREVNRIAEAFGAAGECVVFATPGEMAAGEESTGGEIIVPVCTDSCMSVNRRRTLADILHFWAGATSREVVFEETEVGDFGTVSCNPARCTECLACLNGCNIESLSWDEPSMALRWTGALCIGCQACVSICPENALEFDPAVGITDDFFAPRILSQAEPIRCVSCGKVFGTRKSYERVIQLLSGRNAAGTAYLDHCENCRVFKLMEAE